MLAECVREFRDLDCGVLRAAGDRFEVSPERLGRLNATKYGELAREVTEVPTKASETPSGASKGAGRPKRPSKDTRKP